MAMSKTSGNNSKIVYQKNLIIASICDAQQVLHDQNGGKTRANKKNKGISIWRMIKDFKDCLAFTVNFFFKANFMFLAIKG